MSLIVAGGRPVRDRRYRINRTVRAIAGDTPAVAVTHVSGVRGLTGKALSLGPRRNGSCWERPLQFERSIATA